jgi:hypothetical protein
VNNIVGAQMTRHPLGLGPDKPTWAQAYFLSGFCQFLIIALFHWTALPSDSRTGQGPPQSIPHLVTFIVMYLVYELRRRWRV